MNSLLFLMSFSQFLVILCKNHGKELMVILQSLTKNQAVNGIKGSLAQQDLQGYPMTTASRLRRSHWGFRYSMVFLALYY